MNPDIDIVTILTTQNDLRNVSQIRQMMDFVDAGGFFTQVDLLRYVSVKRARMNPPMITLTEFPDGVIASHDGHHRLVSIYLAGRRLLRGDEYIIKKFTYPDYTEINLSNGWFTPFDPITEIRLSEFGGFKREVRRLMTEYPIGVEDYIINNKHLYAAARDVNFINELAERIMTRMEYDHSSGSGFCQGDRW